MLENNIKISSIFSEISNAYEIPDEQADEVHTDIEQFLSGLVTFGLLSFSSDYSPTFIKPGCSEDSSSQEIKIGMLERLYKNEGLLYKALVEITYACNLRCKHCYRTEAVSGTSATCDHQFQIDCQRVLTLLDKLETEGVVEVYITGGEAFLHPDIYTILSYASQKNFLTTVLTNGNFLANKQSAERLAGLDLFDIRVSIYGNRESHDAFTTCKGSFDKSLRCLENVHKVLGIGTAVFVATQDSIHDIDYMAEEFKRKGINLSINPVIIPTSEGALFPLKFRLSLQDYEKLCKKYRAMLNGSTCTVGISRLRITPQGDVDGCELLPDSKLGNLHTSSLSNILNNKRRAVFVERYKASLNLFPCSDCQKRPYCNVCPGAFYLETKQYGAVPKYRCGMTEAKIHSFAR